MKKFGLGLLTFFLIISIPTLWNRIRKENTNRQVEICLDWQEFNKVCQDQFCSEEEFLLRIRELGVISLGISEETRKSLQLAGKILVFSKEEKEKLLLLGIISSSAFPLGEVWVIQNKNIKKNISRILETKFDKKINKIERGGYLLIGLPQRETDCSELNLGFDESEIQQIKSFGFNTILKLESYPDVDNFSIEIKETISGFYLNQNKRWLVNSEKSELFWNTFTNNKLFIEEFGRLDGIKPILNTEKLTHLSRIRLHRFGEKDYPTYTTSSNPINKSVDRLVRAVKERNIRVLYLYPLPKEWVNKGVGNCQEENWLELQYRYLLTLKNELESHGFSCALARPFDIKNVNNTLFRKLLALLTAILFPIIGMIYMINRIKLSINNENIWWLTIKNFLIITILNIIACLFIAALLPGDNFLLKITEFSGIKIALLLPLILIFFYLYRDYGKSIFRQTVSLGNFVIFIVLGIVLLLFVVRSGNQASSFFSQYEELFRQVMENWLFARPRIKEFLFAHPLLILGIYLLIKQSGKEKHPVLATERFTIDYRFFLLFGFIGQVSIINSFCHLHTPLTLSLLRTFHGLWIGIIIGFILIKLWNILEHRCRRIKADENR